MSAEPIAVSFAETMQPRPILKWAGGKTQLIPELMARFPRKFGKYIEPFFGGGALFFATPTKSAVISDINPELINLYRAVADDVEAVIGALRLHANDEDYFYEVRAQDWRTLDASVAAARTIFLNRTCYNGLYRVNCSGDFNTPYGNYRNPRILDEDNLRAASKKLAGADIRLGGYKTILEDAAMPGDLVFLDPPYLPISAYSDFKRYTKEQFYEEDHRDLALEVERLHDLGCHILLTNSNHPLVHELFQGFTMDIIKTKRRINSNADKRTGEDVIVTVPPRRRFSLQLVKEPLDDQTLCFPTTRFMGSKSKLLTNIWSVASQFDYTNVIDLFSGSGIVSYMFKAKGKNVLANDYMAFSANLTQAVVANSEQTLPLKRAERLVSTQYENDGFVTNTFQGLYFTDEDNLFIDSMRAGIPRISNSKQRAIALASLIRACLKKRPRGIFTYVGMRYDDGRKDLQLSFQEHFLNAVESINAAVFDNGGHSRSRHGDAMSAPTARDSLVYIDPPYYSPLSDNEYVRRYHFVEGLARNWQGVDIQKHTMTKKFKSYPTPFSSRVGARDAFDKLFRRHRGSILLVSYSSNSQPTMDEMLELLSRHKRHVEVVPVDYQYSFGTQGHKVGKNNNKVQEYLFIGY